MASSSELRSDANKDVGGQQTLTDVMIKIDALCMQSGLSYQHHAPVQVSPGVWMFYAVKMDESCKSYGSCRQRQYFAIETAGRLSLA